MDVWEDILNKLNWRLLKSNQNILLLMDNAGCHPKELVSKFANIKIIFLPANTTFATSRPWYNPSFQDVLPQALFELCCVQDWWVWPSYWCGEICERFGFSQIGYPSVEWSKSDTITKYFRNAGVFNDVLEAAGLDHAGADGSVDWYWWRFRVAASNEQTGCESCTPQEFISGDADLPVCVEMDDENWENTFLEELTAAEGEAEDASQEMDKNDDGPVVPKEDVCQFLEHKGHEIEALSIGSSIDHIVALNNSNSQQATLYECHSMNIDIYLAHFRPF